MSIIYKDQRSSEADTVLKTSEVTSYDGIGLINVTVAAVSSLNDVIVDIDNAIGSVNSTATNNDSRLTTIEGDYLVAADETSIRADFASADTNLQNNIDALEAQDIGWDGTAIANIGAGPYADVKAVIVAIDSAIGAITPGTADSVLDEVVNNYVVSDGGYAVTDPITYEITMNASTYIVDGIYKTEGASAFTLQDNKTNYVRYEEATGYQVESVAIGNPATVLTGVPLWRIDINATVISAGVDRRVIYPHDGSLLADDSIVARHVTDNILPSTKLTNSGVAAATYTLGELAINAKGVVTSATEKSNFVGLADGDIMVYNNATSKWDNSTQANWLPSSVANGFLLYDGTSHVTSSTLKEVTAKIGIGKSPANEKLEINGAIVVGSAAASAAGTIAWDGSDFLGYDGSASNNLASIEDNAQQVDLPVYADNAAAKVGGLVDTNFYRTSTGAVMQVYT